MDVNELLSFTIAGLSTAAIFAVIASGLVLTYTTTGVFNFAHGAVGMLAAFAYWQLHIGWGWPLVPSVAVVLFVAAPVFGLAFELVMRGLAGTSETLRFVVTVSLMFGIIGVAQAIWNPDTNRSVKQFFPGDKIDLGPTNITVHQLITIIVAVGVAIGLRLLLYGTRIGVAMRAAVDDRVLTQLNGARTVRVQQLSWVISTVLAAVGGVLVASVAGLNAIVMSLLIVNAYAAAIFGRLRSLPLTFLGAVVVGLTDGYLQGYLPDNPYVRGLRLASPVLVLFLVLLLIPNPRLSGHKGTREYFPAPSVEGIGIFCVVVVLVGVAMATTLSPPDLVTYGKIFPFAIIALSLVPLVGFANQISLCQLSFAGIGAVVMAHHGQGGNPLGLVAAAAVAAFVGAIVALPALRLSGIYLALATAAFAVALDRWIFDLQDFHVAVHDVSVLGVVVAAVAAGAVVVTYAMPALRAYTGLLTVGGLAVVVTVFLLDRSVFGLADFSLGGQQDVSLFRQGALGVDRLDLFGWELDTSTEQMILSATVLAIVSAGVAAVRRGRFGRRLIALRDSEAACATFGIGIVSSRVAVFAFSAGIAGLGGALLGMQLTSVQRADFEFVQGLPIFFLVVVGGAGFVSAGLSAGMFLYGMFPFTTAVAAWYTKWQGLTAGFVGVTAGIEPSGSAPQFRNGFRHLIDERGLKYGTIVALVLVWLGRLAELYDNWPFVLATIGVFFGCTGIGEVLARRRGEAPSWVRPANQAGWRDRRSGAVRLSAADLERDLGLAEPIAELTAAGSSR